MHDHDWHSLIVNSLETLVLEGFYVQLKSIKNMFTVTDKEVEVVQSWYWLWHWQADHPRVGPIMERRAHWRCRGIIYLQESLMVSSSYYYSRAFQVLACRVFKAVIVTLFWSRLTLVSQLWNQNSQHTIIRFKNLQGRSLIKTNNFMQSTGTFSYTLRNFRISA